MIVVTCHWQWIWVPHTAAALRLAGDALPVAALA